MKTRTLYIILALSALLAVGIYLYNRRKKEQDSAIPGPQGPPQDAGPAPGTPGQTQQLFSTDSGQGEQAIRSRIEEITRRPGIRQDIAQEYGLLQQLYQGLNYPNGMKTAISSIFGSAGSVPIIPPQVEPGYSQRLEDLEAVPGFEQLTRTQGGNPSAAFTNWKNALNFSDEGVNFWPPDLETLIRAGSFGQIGSSDRNLSERYDAFTSDFKVFAANLARANRELGEILRAQAIEDLCAAGWRFIGYDVAETANN